MRKGFFSLATATLVAFVLLAFTAGTLMMSHAGGAVSKELEVKKVGDRAQDALWALNSTLEDAVLDRAWQACGCNGTNETLMNSTHLLGNLSQYFNDTALTLSNGLVSVQVLNLTLESYNPVSCNGTFTVNTSYLVLVNSTSTRALREVQEVRQVTTYNSSTEFNMTLPRTGGNYTLRVSCS